MQKYHSDLESEPSSLCRHRSPTENLHSPLTPSTRFLAQSQFSREDFPLTEDFLSSGNLNRDESGQDSEIEYNHKSQNTPSQLTNLSNVTLNPAIFLLDSRLKEIQELLVVKPCGRPSGSLNKKQRQKSNDFE